MCRTRREGSGEYVRIDYNWCSTFGLRSSRETRHAPQLRQSVGPSWEGLAWKLHEKIHDPIDSRPVTSTTQLEGFNCDAAMDFFKVGSMDSKQYFWQSFWKWLSCLFKYFHMPSLICSKCWSWKTTKNVKYGRFFRIPWQIVIIKSTIAMALNRRNMNLFQTYHTIFENDCNRTLVACKLVDVTTSKDQLDFLSYTAVELQEMGEWQRIHLWESIVIFCYVYHLVIIFASLWLSITLDTDLYNMGSNRNRSRPPKMKFAGHKQKNQDGSAHCTNPEVPTESASKAKIRRNCCTYPTTSDGNMCQEGFILFDVNILCKFIEEKCSCSFCLSCWFAYRCVCAVPSSLRMTTNNAQIYSWVG